MKKLFLLSLFVFSLLFSTQTASALSILVEPWYDFTLEIDQSSLPSTVQAVPESSYNGNVQAINFVNTSDTPYLIVVKNKQLNPRLLKNTGLPPEYIPVAKFQNSKEYHWILTNEQVFNEELQAYDYVYDWREYSSETTNSSPYLYPFSMLETLQAYDVQLAENPVSDNRPQGTQPPPDQPFELIAYYGTEIQPLRGRITYSLNNRYDPKGESKAEEKVRAWDRQMESGISDVDPIVGLAARAGILVIAVLLLILIIYFSRKSIQKTEKTTLTDTSTQQSTEA